MHNRHAYLSNHDAYLYLMQCKGIKSYALNFKIDEAGKAVNIYCFFFGAEDYFYTQPLPSLHAR